MHMVTKHSHSNYQFYYISPVIYECKNICEIGPISLGPIDSFKSGGDSGQVNIVFMVKIKNVFIILVQLLSKCRGKSM